jgi:hypothetical protein
MAKVLGYLLNISEILARDGYALLAIYLHLIANIWVEGLRFLLALPTQTRIPIVFRFIIEYSSLRDFGAPR